MPRIAFFLGCLFTAAGFAGPREDVLRVAPDDAGLCVLVTDLRGTLDRLQSSPFARRFLASPAGRAVLKHPDVLAVAQFDRHLRAGFQSSWSEFRDEIAGDALALAFVPGPPDKPDDGGGLVALHARNSRLLGRLFDRLNELQRRSGELTQIERREHRGVGYWLRRKKAGGNEFAAMLGQLFLLSDREDILRAALDRAGTSGPPPLADRLERLGVGRAAAVWWLNPRAFDSALKRKSAKAEGAEADFLAAFVRHWQEVEGAALHLHLGRDAELGLTVASKHGPAAPVVPSAALAGFPADAMLVAGSRLSFDELVRTGREFLSPVARTDLKVGLDRSLGAVLGRDAPAALLAAAGPDWGLCVAPPDESALVPTLTFALKLQNEGDPPAPRRALEGLDFAARLFALAYNGQYKGQLELRSETQGNTAVRIIDGDPGLPPGLRPAYAWKRGYLVIASSPQAVRRFEPPEGGSVAQPSEVVLARLAVQNVAAYLRSRSGAWAAYLAKGDKGEEPAFGGRIDGLLAALDLFDTVELTQRVESHRATLTLRVKPADALAAGAQKNPTELPASRSLSGAGTEKRP